MKIKIENQDFEVNPEDKIITIKKDVEKLCRVPDYCQIFYYNDKRIYENYTFSDYNIKDGSRLELLNLNDITIILKFQNILRRNTIYLNGSDTEYQIKKQIFLLYKIPKDYYDIYYESMPIKNQFF